LTIVSMSYAALTAIPARQSGVAASTLNTAREIGGIAGVAVLGSLMNSKLINHLTSELVRLNVPERFRAFIVAAVTHGGLTGAPATSGTARQAQAQYGKVVEEVIHAAYQAFGQGLGVALLTAGLVLLAAAVVAFFTIREPAGALEDRDEAVRRDRGVRRPHFIAALRRS
jgi:hypothetical protein